MQADQISVLGRFTRPEVADDQNAAVGLKPDSPDISCEAGSESENRSNLLSPLQPKRSETGPTDDGGDEERSAPASGGED
jgi:hypothetical protein